MKKKTRDGAMAFAKAFSDIWTKLIKNEKSNKEKDLIIIETLDEIAKGFYEYYEEQED